MVHVDNLFPVRPEVSNDDASQYFVNPCTGDELRKHPRSPRMSLMGGLLRLCCVLRAADALL